MTKKNESPYEVDFGKVENFFDQKSAYGKIVKNNYMYHREMFQYLKIHLYERFHRQNKSFNLLDLGCGNAYYMSKTLEESKIEFYRGIDLSQESLDEAKVNIEKLDCDYELEKQDLNSDLEILFDLDQRKYDVIWSSFFLHHLSNEKKELFFKFCKNALKPQGALLLVDGMRENYESREDTLEKFFKLVDEKWLNLSTEDRALIYEHVTSSDFPSTVREHRDLSGKHGFNNVNVLLNFGMFKLLRFEISPEMNN